MNYYERYLGDYQRDTGDLSLIEHGAYTQLLDHYYATEMPLPAEMARLYRVCRAVSPDEQAAVVYVVEKFFPVGDDGARHNARADAEIEKARNRIETARINGRAGGRKPNGNPPGYPAGNPPGNPSGNPPGTQQGTHRGDSPHAIHHVSALASGNARATPAGLACRAMKDAGISDVNPSDAELLSLLNEGATPDEFGDLAAELRATDSTVRFRYVVRTMAGRRRDAAKRVGSARAAMPAAEHLEGYK